MPLSEKRNSGEPSPNARVPAVVLHPRAASRSRLLESCHYDKTAGTEYEEEGHATTKLTRCTRNGRYCIMTKQSVVQDYKHPQPGTTPTFTVDEKVRREVWNNGIRRPKGYVVSYHANPDMEKMHFGPKHPMKPWRLTLTNKIVLAYGMHEAMDLYIPRAATPQELKEFHREDYIEFLQRYSSGLHPNTFKDAEYSTESLLRIIHGTQRVARMHTIPATTALYSTVFITTARSTPEPHSTPPASLRIINPRSPSTGQAVYIMRRRPKPPASATSTISSSQFFSCCCTTLVSSTSISTSITVTASSKPSGLQTVL